MSKSHDALTAAQLPREERVDVYCTVTFNIPWANGQVDTVSVVGPYGVVVCRADQPMEIGTAVAEVLMNNPMTPPTSYRKETPKPVELCSYPRCTCPFDAPADPNWCARGLPHKEKAK